MTAKKYLATFTFIIGIFSLVGNFNFARADAIDVASAPTFQIVPRCLPRHDIDPATGKPSVDASNLISKAGPDGKPEYECGFGDIIILLQNIISFLLYASFTLAVIVTAYAGFEYLTSAGSTEKISKAHSMFKKAAFGMIIAFTSWLIVDLILKTLLDRASYDSGNYSLLQKN